MPHSSLISGRLLTNNCSSPRNHVIDTITPHYMCWYATAKECCESFFPTARRASANYCIGRNGEIWLNVDEGNRAWTSGNSDNDNRAITIECANYMDSARYGVLPDVVWSSLIRLCVDICKRYNKKQLIYTGSANYNILGKYDMLLTKHKWFQDTDCPGPWLDKKFNDLANEVNSILSGDEPSPIPPMVFGGIYECRVDCLNVRESPTIYSEVIAEYHYGETVILDDWFKSNDGFIWGRYTGSSSGLKRYVAVGKDTGKVENDDFLIKLY